MQKQIRALKQMSPSITEQNRFLKEHVDSPFAKFNQLTRQLILELVCHQQYTIIGRVHVTPEPESKERIDFNVQRFKFENTSMHEFPLFGHQNSKAIE